MKRQTTTLHIQVHTLHFVGYEDAWWCPVCGTETSVNKPMYGKSLDCPVCKTHYHIAPYEDCSFENTIFESTYLIHGLPL